MYCHLLVPIDDTALSSANVQQAVELAAAWKARITFVHALRDAGAGALSRFDPLLRNALGDTQGRALLAKAAAAAAGAGVPSQTLPVQTHRPAEAIIEAARKQGCDLIVMASRGLARGSMGGWLYNSQTERVLRSAPVALLVTRVNAAQPLSAADQAIGTIQDEHRSIAVVIKSMQAMTEDAAILRGGPLDLDSLDRMLGYLMDFPARVHHPKEDEHLLQALRDRCPDSHPIVEEVMRQHRTEEGLLLDVLQTLQSTRQAGPAALQALAQSVRALANHVLEHMGFEEHTVLPLARARLTPEDWQRIADAFALNDDPHYGDLPADEFRRLFRRIASQPLACERAAALAGA